MRNVTIAGVAVKDDAGQLAIPMRVRDGSKVHSVTIPLDPDDQPPPGWDTPTSSSEPYRCRMLPAFWLYRGKVVFVDNDCVLTDDEIKLEVAHVVMKHEQRYTQLKRHMQAYSILDAAEGARRERIPDSVRIFVWQRDEGRCVQCGSNEKLEFDHIIPIVKGGANTERNIQLLCETCNRRKTSNI